MIPSGARPAMPAGVFLVGDEPGGIRSRVNRLVLLAGAPRQPGGWSIPKALQWAAPLSLLFAVIFFAAYTSMLATVHSLIEHAVYLLD
jgi:hypothetical protein